MNDTVKRNDQIELLKRVLESEQSGEEMRGGFTYPNCGYDLVRQELVTRDGKLTTAGKAALWLLDIGPDPTGGASFVTFNLPIPKSESDTV